MDVSRFIPPAAPVLRPRQPTGANWQYEVKLDGYRVQLHKVDRAVTIYSKNGSDFTRRFPSIATAVLGLLLMLDGPRAKPVIDAGSILTP